MRRSRSCIGLVALVAVVALVAWLAVRWMTPHHLRAEGCQAAIGKEYFADVDLEQARWAALMAAIAEKRGLPPRATTIAVAAAFQESKLRNIDYGDRDSLGLFQQRPSQGWGSAEDIMRPAYAIGKFYEHLVQVPGYETMEITVAAQKVQRSGYPSAYAQHEPEARALSAALRGQYPTALTCFYRNGGDDSMATRLHEGFGSGLKVKNATVMVADTTRGWSVAHFIVANAAGTSVDTVTYAGHQWTRADGWKSDSTSTSTRTIRYHAVS